MFNSGGHCQLGRVCRVVYRLEGWPYRPASRVTCAYVSCVWRVMIRAIKGASHARLAPYSALVSRRDPVGKCEGKPRQAYIRSKVSLSRGQRAFVQFRTCTVWLRRPSRGRLCRRARGRGRRAPCAGPQGICRIAGGPAFPLDRCSVVERPGVGAASSPGAFCLRVRCGLCRW